MGRTDLEIWGRGEDIACQGNNHSEGGWKEPILQICKLTPPRGAPRAFLPADLSQQGFNMCMTWGAGASHLGLQSSAEAFLSLFLVFVLYVRCI